MNTLFTTLLQNTAVIIVFVFLFGMSLSQVRKLPVVWQRAVMGGMFGLFGVLNMAWAIMVQAGIIIDIRGPFIVAAGVYGGWLGGGIAAGMVGLYRLFGVGGVGALPALLSIMANVALGALWYKRMHKVPVWGWPLLGLASLGASVASGLLLPPESVRLFLASFVPVALVLYPAATLVIVLLIRREYERLELLTLLRMSEARFRAIFNHSFQMTGLLSPDGTLLEANDSALKFAGIAADEAVGKPFWETRWWNYSPVVQARLKHAIEQATAGDFVRYQDEIQGKEGQHMTIDFSLKPLRDENGQTMLLIPEGRDITDHIRAEERRIALRIEKEQNRLYRDFIADSSHHLRTPLTVLRTSVFVIERLLGTIEADLALMEPHVKADGMPFLTQVRQKITRAYTHLPNHNSALKELSQTIEGLLELSRMDTLRETHITPVDLNRLILTAIEKYTDVAEEAALSLAYTPHEGALTVMTDAQDMRYAIDNLIDNAIKYTPAGGRVTLTLRREGESVLIGIRDTGIGITPEGQKRIFERFYRGKEAARTKTRGSGLGLAIVEKKVALHGGCVRVESTPGEGSYFEVQLPAVLP